MIFTLIMCAGKQKRFESHTPKALMRYRGRNILDLNVKMAEKFSDKVYVVVSKENAELFKENVHSKNWNFLEIESGFGSGDAVLKAINMMKYQPKDTVFIMWGDSIQDNPKLFEDTKAEFENKQLDVCLPVKLEERPYCQIVVDGFMNVLGAKFSKSNERISKNSFHDLCLFYGYCYAIKRMIELIPDEIKKFRGNDLEFLDCFNTENTFKAKAVETDYAVSKSFNTLKELDEIL